VTAYVTNDESGPKLCHERIQAEWRYSSTHLSLDGVTWLVSRPGRFIPGERIPGTNSIAGSVCLVWTFRRR